MAKRSRVKVAIVLELVLVVAFAAYIVVASVQYKREYTRAEALVSDLHSEDAAVADAAKAVLIARPSPVVIDALLAGVAKDPQRPHNGRRVPAAVMEIVGIQIRSDEENAVLVAIGEPAVEALAKVLVHDTGTGPWWYRGVFKVSPGFARGLKPGVGSGTYEAERCRVNAAHVLGSIGGAEAVKGLEKALTDLSQEVRIEAVKALGKIGGKEALPALEKALEDKDGFVCREAALALGKIGDPSSLDAVVKALKDPRQHSWSVGDEVLRGFGKAALPYMLTMLDVDVNQRYYLQALFVEFGSESVEWLTKALSDENVVVRRNAAKILGRIEDAGAAEPLIAALEDEDGQVRCNAVYSLQRHNDARAEGPLVAVLRNEGEESRTRAGAARALGGLRTASAADVLIAAAGEPDGDVRKAVAVGLGLSGDKRAVGPLVTLADDGGSGVRREAVRSLGLLGHEVRSLERDGDHGGLDAVVRRLADEDREVRETAVASAYDIGLPGACDALYERMRADENEWIRNYAAVVLADFGDSRALPVPLESDREADEGPAVIAMTGEVTAWNDAVPNDPTAVAAESGSMQIDGRQTEWPDNMGGSADAPDEEKAACVKSLRRFVRAEFLPDGLEGHVVIAGQFAMIPIDAREIVSDAYIVRYARDEYIVQIIDTTAMMAIAVRGLQVDMGSGEAVMESLMVAAKAVLRADIAVELQQASRDWSESGDKLHYAASAWSRCGPVEPMCVRVAASYGTDLVFAPDIAMICELKAAVLGFATIRAVTDGQVVLIQIEKYRPKDEAAQ